MKPAIVHYAAGVAARHVAFWTPSRPEHVALHDRSELLPLIDQIRPRRIAVAAAEWCAIHPPLSPVRYAVRAVSPLAATYLELDTASCKEVASFHASAAAAGMVMTQATTMRWAMFQRTAEARREAPTPTMAPVMVWVVETGMPK